MGNDPSLDCGQHGDKAAKCKFVKQVYLIDAQCGTHINGPSPKFNAIYDEVMVSKKQDRCDRHMVDYLDACNHVLRYHTDDVKYCDALRSPAQCALQNCHMLQRHYSCDKFRESSVLQYIDNGDDSPSRAHDVNQMLFFQAIDSFHEFLHHNHHQHSAMVKRALVQKWNRHYYSSLAIRFVGLHNHHATSAQSELELNKKKSKLHAHPSKGDLSNWTTRTHTASTPGAFAKLSITHAPQSAQSGDHRDRLQSVDAYDSDSTALQSNTANLNLKLNHHHNNHMWATSTNASANCKNGHGGGVDNCNCNLSSGSESGSTISGAAGAGGGATWTGRGGAHDSLRSEIEHECALSKLCWDALVLRASQMAQAAELKRVRHKHDSNTALSVSHVIVLCLYSSYECFQQKLGELSRLRRNVHGNGKKHSSAHGKEQAKLAKKLHARLGHSFKLLVDAVQNYGYEAPAEYGVAQVYRGLTSLPLLRKYLLACTVPTSVSMSAAAAATFAGHHGNGCVLQLSVPANSRFLPLQFVSLYRCESELLFYGKYSFLCIEKLLCPHSPQQQRPHSSSGGSMSAPPSLSKNMCAVKSGLSLSAPSTTTTAIDLNALVFLEKLTSRYAHHVYHCMEEATYGAVLSRLLRQHQSKWLRGTGRAHRCSLSRSRSESRSLCYIKYRRKSLSQQSMRVNSLQNLNELSMVDQYADELIGSTLDETHESNTTPFSPLPMMHSTAPAAVQDAYGAFQTVHTTAATQSTHSMMLMSDAESTATAAMSSSGDYDEEEEDEDEDADLECTLDDISLHAEFDHYIAKKRILWLDSCELMRLIHGDAAATTTTNSFDEYHLDITKLVDIFYAVRYIKIADSYRVNMNDIITYCKADVHTPTPTLGKKTTTRTATTATPKEKKEEEKNDIWREPKLRQIELFHGYDIEYINKILGIWPNECRWEVFFDLDSVTFKRDVVSQTVDRDALQDDDDDDDQL